MAKLVYRERFFLSAFFLFLLLGGSRFNMSQVGRGTRGIELRLCES